MKRLTDIGFRRVGKWDAILGGIRSELIDLSEEKNILYAFISEAEVLYVGKTTQALKKRMYGYRNPGPTQHTNIKGNRLIKELIAKGKDVEIFALADNGLMHFGVFHMNLAAALEDSIVATVKPKWNHTGK
jgi:hypothetical protein